MGSTVRFAWITAVVLCMVMAWGVCSGLAQQPREAYFGKTAVVQSDAPRPTMRVAESVQSQLPSDARKLVERFEAQSAEIQKATDERICTLRRQIVMALKPMQDEHTRKANLDQAVAIRDCIRILKESEINAQPDPGTLANYNGRIGNVYYFRVTGRTDGPLWGTDVYTSDSLLATAAVHAGVLKNRQSGIVKVTLLPGQAGYQATARNGVVSQPWQTFPMSFTIAQAAEEAIICPGEEESPVSPREKTVAPAFSDKETPNSPQQEVLVLKERVAKLTALQRSIDQRLSKLEQHAATPAAPTTPTRSLGDGLQVDKSGTIWFHGAPIGIWGVDHKSTREKR